MALSTPNVFAPTHVFSDSLAQSLAKELIYVGGPPRVRFEPAPTEKVISERTADDIEAAVEVIERVGWVQHAYSSPDGVCTLGALRVVAGHPLARANAAEVPNYLAAFEASNRVARASTAVRMWLEIHCPGEPTHPAHWNDVPGRSKEDVVLTLKKVAAWVRERAAA